MFNHIYYIRYAYNYLIAFKGEKKIVREIKKKSEKFLKFNLCFELKKGNLIHWKNNKINFLGFYIKVFNEKRWVVFENRKRIFSFNKTKKKVFLKKKVF